MIYLDEASTTKPYKEVINTFSLLSEEAWANPSNIYNISDKPNDYLYSAKVIIASILHCLPEEIFFTSGASEGNAWVCNQGDVIYVSEFEHHNYLENPKAHKVSESFLDEIKSGKIENITTTKQVYEHMLVSNDTGTIFDVAPLFKTAKELDMFTACDITQGFCNIDIHIYDLGCDMAVASAHKFHGLRGTGFVFIKQEVQSQIKPLIYGTQQMGLRGGTENVAGYYAMAIAAQKTFSEMGVKTLNSNLCEAAIYHILDENKIDYQPISWFNKIPSTVMVCLADIETEVIQAMLSDKGIYVGVGSACTTGDFKVNETLAALNIKEKYIHGPVRFSFSKDTKVEDVRYAVQELCNCYKEVRGE